MLEHRFKSELSGGDFGWLNARHHFRVTAEGNPAHRPLGALVVWNDDVIAPGTGFPMHPHQNMEIISCLLERAVTHRDSSTLVTFWPSLPKGGSSRQPGRCMCRSKEARSPGPILQRWLAAMT